jgi:hypothetical protein
VIDLPISNTEPPPDFEFYFMCVVLGTEPRFYTW